MLARDTDVVAPGGQDRAHRRRPAAELRTVRSEQRRARRARPGDMHAHALARDAVEAVAARRSRARRRTRCAGSRRRRGSSGWRTVWACASPARTARQDGEEDEAKLHARDRPSAARARDRHPRWIRRPPRGARLPLGYLAGPHARGCGPDHGASLWSRAGGGVPGGDPLNALRTRRAGRARRARRTRARTARPPRSGSPTTAGRARPGAGSRSCRGPHG